MHIYRVFILLILSMVAHTVHLVSSCILCGRVKIIRVQGDRVLKYWTHAGVVLPPNRIKVVYAVIICYVYSDCIFPVVKRFLEELFAIFAVDYQVYFEQVAHGQNIRDVCCLVFVKHSLTVLFEIFFNEGYIIVRILLQVLHNQLSNVHMLILVTLNLVSDCSEKGVSIIFDRIDFQFMHGQFRVKPPAGLWDRGKLFLFLAHSFLFQGFACCSLDFPELFTRTGLSHFNSI